MDSNRLIDAQFDRAVEIVQGLPKTGPIQTGYEEKLALYSLYKQATVGNVKQSRPGMWDMLGRAKWDAWAKQKDLSPSDAKWAYVETLQKVLRKYPDARTARELSRELTSFSGDPSNLVMSGSLAHSSAQERTTSSDESDDDEEDSSQLYNHPHPLPAVHSHSRDPSLPVRHGPGPNESSEDDGDASEEDPLGSFPPNLPNIGRPTSAISSQHRYRTPMGMSSGVPVQYSPVASPNISHLPMAQPLPRYSTPSAFSIPVADRPSSGSPSIPSSFPTSLSYPQHLAHSVQPYSFRSPHPGGAGVTPPTAGVPLPGVISSQSTRPPLERAVESVQASLAALRERLEGLEAISYGSNASFLARGLGSGSLPLGSGGGNGTWDPSNMGLWSIVLVPITRLANQLRVVLILLTTPPPPPPRGRSGGNLRAIVRRLVLDASFVLTVAAVLRTVWRRTGIRRREVYKALKLVWIALMGRKERIMVDRGV